MKRIPAALLMAMAVASLPAVSSPLAEADVCGTASGPNGSVNGCLPPGLNSIEQGAAVVGGIAVADALDEWNQRAAGRPPCYTPEGVPYYTPGSSPCA